MPGQYCKESSNIYFNNFDWAVTGLCLVKICQQLLENVVWCCFCLPYKKGWFWSKEQSNNIAQHCSACPETPQDKRQLQGCQNSAGQRSGGSSDFLNKSLLAQPWCAAQGSQIPGTEDMWTPPALASVGRREHLGPAAASYTSLGEPHSVSIWHNRRHGGKWHLPHLLSAPGHQSSQRYTHLVLQASKDENVAPKTALLP